MDTVLISKEYEDQKLVWSGNGGQEFSLDYVVPDSMPDVERVISAEGILTLRSRDTQEGSVRLSAAVNANVLYVPAEENRLLSLEVTVPVELSLDAPGTDADCRSAVSLRLRGMDARAINSRKLTLHADVTAEAVCYTRRKIRIPDSTEGKDPVHVLTGTKKVEKVTEVREKTFVVTDEYILPDAAVNMGRLLSRSVEAVVEDIRYVSEKVLFRGRIFSRLMFSAENGDGVFSARFETEFSQLLEADDADAEGEPEIFLSLTGAYYDMPQEAVSGARIGAELHFAAQCVSHRQCEISYIEDIYSNKTCIVPGMAEYALTGNVHRVSQRQTAVGTVEPPCTGEVVYTSVGVSSVVTEGKTAKAGLTVKIISRDDKGRFMLSKGRLSVVFSPEISEDAVLSSVSVAASEVYYSPSGENPEVRVSAVMTAIAGTPCDIVCVESISEDSERWQEEKKNIASVTLTTVPDGADFWSLAKRYHSDTETVNSINTGKTAGLLLIPATR